MSKDPAAQAEGLNYAEKKDGAPERPEGGGPVNLIEQIRKKVCAQQGSTKLGCKRRRSYYRALKRGEPWAVEQRDLFEYVNQAIEESFYEDLRLFGMGAFFRMEPRPKAPEDEL